jgi:hypothetical protein
MLVSRRTWGVVERRHAGDAASVGVPVVRGREAAGRGEVYDPAPPAFVDPGIPGGWVVIVLSPSWLALAGGFLGIRHRWKELLVFSLAAPYVLAIIGVFAILAAD